MSALPGSPMPHMPDVRRRSAVAGVFLFFFSIPALCSASDNFWSVLQRDGGALDIMSANSVAGQLMLIGAKYVEVSWPGDEQPPVQGQLENESVLQSVVRKQLFMMAVAQDEKVVWQNTYPALPDVHEIYSVATNDDQHVCVIYGEQSNDDESVFDPVLLQFDVHGRILWAKRNVISARDSKQQSSELPEQIANLDTLRVTTSPDKGCVLAFVTRSIEKQEEKFRLHIIQHSAGGDVQWQRSLDTELYGKLFLVWNKQASQYVVVQTNQSRDAAVRAMMLAVPFVPKTALIGFDYQGAIIFRRSDPEVLSQLWVKTVLNTNRESFLIAGKTKTAWAGLVNPNGEIKKFTDKLDDEFTASAVDANGFLLSRGDRLTLTSSNLDIVSDQAIPEVTKQQYLNQYLMARLPEGLPVQQIVPVGNNDFLLLYLLGSKIIKVHFDQVKP